jgi:polyhydroxyalkanoate synthesis regulator phasin
MDMVASYKGKLLSEYSKAELIEIIESACREIDRLHEKEHRRLMNLFSK